MKKVEQKVKNKIQEIRKKMSENQSSVKNENLKRTKATNFFKSKIEEYISSTDFFEKLDELINYYLKETEQDKNIFKGFVEPKVILPVHIHGDSHSTFCMNDYCGNILYLYGVPKNSESIIESHSYDENSKKFFFDELDTKFHFDASISLDFVSYWEKVNNGELDFEEADKIWEEAKYGFAHPEWYKVDLDGYQYQLYDILEDFKYERILHGEPPLWGDTAHKEARLLDVLEEHVVNEIAYFKLHKKIL